MRDDHSIEQDWAGYSETEHATWRALFARQKGLLPGRAADAFLNGLSRLPIFGEGIPDFDALNEVLFKTTQWRLVAVPGLVPDEVFFDHLANRRFPAARFIRRPEQMDYLEEPDIFHDVFGHAPMLMLPAFADYMQAYGKGGLRALRLGVLERLARVYWYTVEFGLVQEKAGLRIYGSGIVSSRSESMFCLEDPSPHRLAFELRRVLRTRYRIDDFQECYFVIRGFDQLLELAEIDFTPIYRSVETLPDIAPGDLSADDRVITRGTGAYHKTKS
ncbi:MAG: phenylalanine 4-monooxygenase [Alphaproteobacteria bacterium]|nr:phenylalanine 4-monooxygenase [Alphaproteobacteria bacterium]